MTVKIGIYGANGKMSLAVADSIKKQSKACSLAGIFSSCDDDIILSNLCSESDVIIDFSTSKALEKLLHYATKNKTNLVIGTTGIETKHFDLMQNAAEKIAVLYAANTSVVANLVAILAAQATSILVGYDIEIVEAHHKYKKDAPSGTALMIGEAISAARNIELSSCAVFDRSEKGQRKDGEIGFSSIRAGGIFGEHDVIFAGENELLTISQRALGRAAFADGAVFAAVQIAKKEKGYYSMKDILDFDSAFRKLK